MSFCLLCHEPVNQITSTFTIVVTRPVETRKREFETRFKAPSSLPEVFASHCWSGLNKGYFVTHYHADQKGSFPGA